MASLASLSFPFSDLCAYLDKISEKRKGSQKLLEDLFHEITSLFGRSFYPIVRLVLPQLDHLRPKGGFAGKKLATVFIGALGLAKEGKEAKRLLNPTVPTNNVCVWAME